MITVVVALIQQNGRLLVCQRRRKDHFPLRWEFPGGKVQHGESPAEALGRELAEELAIKAPSVAIGPEVYRTRHRYVEHADELELIFYSATLPGEPAAAPQNLAFEQIRWVAPTELPQFDFLPADRELVALLSTGQLPIF